MAQGEDPISQHFIVQFYSITDHHLAFIERKCFAKNKAFLRLAVANFLFLVNFLSQMPCRALGYFFISLLLSVLYFLKVLAKLTERTT